MKLPVYESSLRNIRDSYTSQITISGKGNIRADFDKIQILLQPV